MVDDAHNGAADVFGLSAFPYFVALDRSGKVVARSSGELEAPALETLFAAARNG
jgi:hypothetical protein